MKKLLVIGFILVCFAGMSYADEVLTGGVKYTTDIAREELLQKTPLKPDGLSVLTNIADENYKENKTLLLKGQAEIKDRVLAEFSDNSYAVMYHENPLYVWYYSPEGILTHIEIKDGTNYPYKSYKYDTEGNLVNMGLRVSKEETFIFDKSGKLIAHWLKDKGYDETGKVIMKRHYKQ